MRPGQELRGILESYELIGGGLIRIRVHGIEKVIPEEMESHLVPLVGRLASILRIDDFYSAVEVP